MGLRRRTSKEGSQRMEGQQPKILISGETGGTGASTTSKLIAEKLSLPVVSGGKYFRALANRFDHFQKQHPELDFDAQYEAFLAVYEQVFKAQGLSGISHMIAEGIEQGAKGDAVAAFSAAIERAQQRKGQIDTVWDYIVDQQTIGDALEKPGFVWEAKLAILSLHFDQMRTVVQNAPTSALPYLHVLLTLDPEVAAQRVGQRESRDVHVNEILERKKRDFDRYGSLYSIRGRKVAHGDLARHADVSINTETITPPEVASEILRAYIQRLSAASSQNPEHSLVLIKSLYEAIDSLSE